MSQIMIIGGEDISEYCTRDNIQISQSPVYASQTLTTITGAVKKKKLGVKYSISLNLEDIPDDLKKSIWSKCSGNVTVSFAAAGITTALFEEPNISAKLMYKDDSGVYYWSIDISMTSEVIPCDGL